VGRRSSSATLRCAPKPARAGGRQRKDLRGFCVRNSSRCASAPMSFAAVLTQPSVEVAGPAQSCREGGGKPLRSGIRRQGNRSKQRAVPAPLSTRAGADTRFRSGHPAQSSMAIAKRTSYCGPPTREGDRYLSRPVRDCPGPPCNLADIESRLKVASPAPGFDLYRSARRPASTSRYVHGRSNRYSGNYSNRGGRRN